MEKLTGEEFILKVIGGQALRIEQLSGIVKEFQEKNMELTKELVTLRGEKGTPMDASKKEKK